MLDILSSQVVSSSERVKISSTIQLQDRVHLSLSQPSSIHHTRPRLLYRSPLEADCLLQMWQKYSQSRVSRLKMDTHFSLYVMRYRTISWHAPSIRQMMPHWIPVQEQAVSDPSHHEHRYTSKLLPQTTLQRRDQMNSTSSREPRT